MSQPATILNRQPFRPLGGGLLLVGSGLSLTGHAILLNSTAPPDACLGWVAWGTAGLVIVNAGICCVVEAAFAKREARSNRK